VNIYVKVIGDSCSVEAKQFDKMASDLFDNRLTISIKYLHFGNLCIGIGYIL